MRFFWLLPLTLWAQYEVPRLLGLAGAQVALVGEPLSANPAGTFPSGLWGFSGGSAFYVLTPELSYHTLGLAFRLDSVQAISLIGHYWGFDKLTHLHGGIGYALRLLRGQITLSVRGRFLHTNLQEYGQVSQGTPDVGLLWQVSPKVRVGGYGFNLLGRGWGRLPGAATFGLGMVYEPSVQVQLLSEVHQAERGPWTLHTALQYRPVSLLILRLGVAAPLLQVGGGLSLVYKRVAIDFGYRYYPTTGSWAGAGFTYPAL
jgi:hypothetical protein